MSSVFAADWLSLREPLDHQSRSAALLRRLNGRLNPGQGPVLDLGAGHGSNLRYLAPRLPACDHWLLLDQDARLLATAAQGLPELAPIRPAIETRALNLTRLPQLELPRPSLVTASALIDLASADWLDALAQRCRDWQVPVLIALSVDGRRGFIDQDGNAVVDKLDETCRIAFNRHQCQSKGLGWGKALGPEAVTALKKALERRGFHVELAASDWRIAADTDQARGLGRALLEDWHQAVADTGQLDSRELATWLRMRRAALATGQLGLVVGHQDLLALPSGPGHS